MDNDILSGTYQVLLLISRSSDKAGLAEASDGFLEDNYTHFIAHVSSTNIEESMMPLGCPVSLVPCLVILGHMRIKKVWR